MKFLMIVFCFILVTRFVYNFQRINCRDGWKWFIKSTIDAFLIIAFAILERGRW